MKHIYNSECQDMNVNNYTNEELLEFLGLNNPTDRGLKH